MKFIVTGSLGNISRPLTQSLVKDGHDVTVISSKKENEAAIKALGAKAAIGSIEDEVFLTKTFTGADAVYTMVPPSFTASDYRAYFAEIGKIYARAIKAAKVTRVVNLSSIGADLPSGTGPIAGLYDVENSLNSLENVAIKHLRPAFFYVNFLHNIGLIKNAGIIGSNYPANARLLMTHPADIVVAAREELEKTFTGKTVRYVTSDDRPLADVASVLGKAIGKPELPWVEFNDKDSLEGMKQSGMSPALAVTYVEMGNAVKSGILWGDYDATKAGVTGKIKLEDFGSEFAEKYNQ